MPNPLDDRPISHEATVEELQTLLADPKLRPTDLLVPNSVRNLAIFRDEEFIGFVDLLGGCVCIEWSEEE